MVWGIQGRRRTSARIASYIIHSQLSGGEIIIAYFSHFLANENAQISRSGILFLNGSISKFLIGRLHGYGQEGTFSSV